MILESSVLVSVFGRDRGHRRLVERMEAAPSLAINAATLAEAGVILAERLEPFGQLFISRIREEGRIAVIPFDDDHQRAARQAFARYGAGRHQAGLSFPECVAYATARLAGAPLLYEGGGFALTDLAIAPE